MLKVSGLGLLFMGISLASVAAEVYQIDHQHSFANFSIRHVVSKAAGTFPDIRGKIVIDRDDLSQSSVDAVINVASVNTAHAKRDQHLLEKPEYLEPGKFGQMTFVSTRVEATGKEEGILHGKLTLHGVTREISFPFKVLGFGADPWGDQRAGFEGKTSLKASDYGFGWAAKPNGPVGNEIDITLLIEGVKEKQGKP
jgi:polyisoprenoid-binding protein YceI